MLRKNHRIFAGFILSLLAVIRMTGVQTAEQDQATALIVFIGPLCFLRYIYNLVRVAV